MSEKTEVDQEYDKDEDASQSSGNVPEQQYSREELIGLSKAGQRPKCLDPAYDSEDGRWDPDRWYKAQFELPGEVSPVTMADGKDRRRATELDRDVKRIPSLNEPVERLKEERDGIVLGPQRRSFGTGCHVQTTLLYTRQLTLPDRDRDESRGEKERERDRERPVRKIGSGRIQIDRENSRDYSGLRDRFDDRDTRDREQDRDRDFAWNRERDWDRDVRETEWDRDRRFDRSDRFRRVADFPDRDRRDRDFRERGFDRNPRRRNNHRGDEKEPEWFTRGPSSQNDTIELRGFDQEGVGGDDAVDGAVDRTKQNKRTTPSEDKSSKESSEETSEADVKLSQRSSPEEDQQVLRHEHPEMSSQAKEQEPQATTPQQNPRVSPSTHSLFDFEEILKANFRTLDEEPIYQGSRFSRFFSGMNGNMQGSDTSSMEDLLVPHNLLEDSHTSSTLPSPTSMMGSVPPHMGQMQHGMHHFPDHQGTHLKEHLFSLQQNYMNVPSPAGDNNAALNKSSVLPCVTALFNRTSLGGPNTSSATSNNFNTQDAEAQLKAMLFGGHKESASSSGTASPASLPPNVQRKVKTVAELEADMHQNSPQKRNVSLSVNDGLGSPSNSCDMTAFNKLLILINAASEASQHTTQSTPQISLAGFGMAPRHGEFNHAVLRNREEQLHLQQQTLQKAHHQPFHPQSGIPPQHPPPLHHPHQHIPAHNHQQHPQSMMNQQPLSAAATFQQMQKSQQQHAAMNHSQQIAGLLIKPPGTPGLPMGMSSPHNSAMKPRAHSGGPLVSSDPIYNIIQQNPTIVMNPASPGPSMAAILASQQSVVASTARVPSPLMFSQQPPLHLSAPSPIHPGQLSPRSLTVGGSLTTSTINSPTDMRSPVLHRVLSPQELSAHAQAVMQSALIKKQLLDQNERYLKKQLERARSPSQQQTNILKPQSVGPPVPPAKNIPMNTFTPTSVLRKMHSDKALDKEKLVMDGHGDEDMDFMRDFGGGQHDLIDSRSLDGNSRRSEKQFLEDLCDISFLDPVNTDLVAMTNQLRVGQTHILPGPLSQPMSVEEKMKLSALAENPGYLSQMLDKSAKMSAVEASRTNQGRPIVKAQEPSNEDRNLQQHLYALQHQPPPPIVHPGRPVTGGSPNMQLSFAGLQQSMQTNLASKPASSGRAIVGGNSSQQQTQMPGVPAQNIDMLRMLDLQRLQQMPHSQGMVLPPPPMGTPISCLGPPPGTAPISVRIPGHSGANAALMHQQMARANANAISAQHNQQISQFLAAQQHRHMPPLPSHHMVMPSGPAHMSPRSQATGPLSPAALNATIQRVASPHSSLKMNGPLPMTSAVNGGSGPKIDMNSGIQRWFSPDILRTQLPSMPPLPTKGNKVMTVDELEGN